MSEPKSERYRFSLSDMVVVVCGSAFAFSMTRGVTGLVGVPSQSGFGLLTGVNPAASRIDPYRLFALLMILIGSGLLVGIAVSAWRHKGALWPIAWRLGSALILGLFLNAISERISDTPPLGLPGQRLEAEVKVLGLCLGLASAGVILAASAPRPRSERRRSPWFAWAGPASALLEGVIYLTLMWGMVAYLVLIAMEAVRLAMSRPGEMAWLKAHGGVLFSTLEPKSLARRIDEATRDGLAVCLACVACATWLGLDLRGESKEKPGRIGWAFRITTALACWVGLAWLLFVTFPRFQIWYRDGFAYLIRPRMGTAAIAGFGLFVLGISARATAAGLLPRRPRPEPPLWRKRASTLARCAVAGLAIAVTISAIERKSPGTLPSRLDPIVMLGSHVTGFLTDPAAELRNLLPGSWSTATSLFELESLLLWGFAAWLTLASLALLFGRADRVSSLDAVGASPAPLLLWLVRGLAATGVIMALFPAVFITSLGLTKFSL